MAFFRQYFFITVYGLLFQCGGLYNKKTVLSVFVQLNIEYLTFKTFILWKF